MKQIYIFKQFVDEITAENSRLYKITVLEKYKEDETIKYYLKFLYDPYITTGISEKKLNKNVGNQPGHIWLDYSEDSVIFEYIKDHNTGTDVDIWTIQEFRKTQIIDKYHELFNAIITKNLQLGVDVKTINKVIPNLIPTFNVQLANKYFDNPKIVEGKKFALTTKIDGGRIIAIKKNGEAKFYTRQGQEYEGLIDLKDEMEKYMPDNICLDGEITLLNKGNLTSKDQYKQTMKITRKDGEKHGVKMLVFDCMTSDEFESQKCNRPYSERAHLLSKILQTDYKFSYFEKLNHLYVGDDTSKIIEYLTTETESGEEGVMINIWDAPYEFRRTNSLLKVKKMQDIDLEIVGFEEGENRHAGRLGAILVDYNGNIVKVGSGFSDELRTDIWQHQDEWLGRTIIVQYFEETTNDHGGTSLRFPVYLDYRTDK